jgi:hypothetical protein
MTIAQLTPFPTPSPKRIRWRGTSTIEPAKTDELAEAGVAHFAVDFGETVQIINTRGMCAYTGTLRFNCKIVEVHVDGRHGRDLPRRVSGPVDIAVAYPLGTKRVEFAITCTEDKVRVGDKWSWLPGEQDREAAAEAYAKAYAKTHAGDEALRVGDKVEGLYDGDMSSDMSNDEEAARVRARKRLFGKSPVVVPGQASPVGVEVPEDD